MTNKDLIKTYVDPDIKSKIKYISEKERRSESNLLEFLADKYINEYEKIHGELIIEPDRTVHPKLHQMGKSSTSKTG